MAVFRKRGPIAKASASAPSVTSTTPRPQCCRVKRSSGVPYERRLELSVRGFDLLLVRCEQARMFSWRAFVSDKGSEKHEDGSVRASAIVNEALPWWRGDG